MARIPFWERASGTPDECWEWQGSRNAQGYGRVKYQGRNRLAYNVAYILTHGEIPKGTKILHSCDNPPCVNPAHLRAGTQSENMQEMSVKGRGRNGWGTTRTYYRKAEVL